SIGEYGLALLATSGEERTIRERHATYFRERVEEAENRYTRDGPRSRNWDDGIVSEVANVRAALTWYRDHDPVNGLSMASGLAWHWVEREFWEGEGWLKAFLARATDDDQVRGRALGGLATLIRRQGNF